MKVVITMSEDIRDEIVSVLRGRMTESEHRARTAKSKSEREMNARFVREFQAMVSAMKGNEK